MRQKKFKKALGSLKDMKVGLFLSDNQFIEGFLLDVKQDHVIMNVNQNVCYFALQHIQAISNNAKDFHIYPQITPYLDRNYLIDILLAMRHNWVTINGLSDQETFGVLSKITENHIMIINNMELVTIPKSYISTIYSRMSEEQIILLNNTADLTIQQSYLLDTNQAEDVSSEQSVDSSQASISHTIDETKEQSESLQEEIEELRQVVVQQITKNNEATLKEKNVVMEVENERRIDDSQKKAIQDFILRMNTESVKQPKFEEAEEIVHSQHKEPIADNHQQSTSNNKSGKSSEHIVMENPSVQEIIVSTVKNEYSDDLSKLEVLEESDLLLLDKHEFMKNDGDHSIEENYKEVLESANSVDKEELFVLTEPQSRHTEKRILLSAWSIIHHEQPTVTSQDNLGEESEYLPEEDNTIMMDLDSEQIKSLNYSMFDNNVKGKISAEKSELTELASIHIPVRKTCQEVDKEMLKMQYYALMIHAAGSFNKVEEPSKHSTLDEKNTFHSQVSLEEQEMLERQYYSLMKYAERMYRQLKDLGLQ